MQIVYPNARGDNNSANGQSAISGRNVIILQQPRGKYQQNYHLGTPLHPKIPHDLNSQAEEHGFDRAAEHLDDCPFGELIAH